MLTEAHAAVLQQVAEVIKHGLLVLSADSAEVAQEAAAASDHFGKGDFLWTSTFTRQVKSNIWSLKQDSCRKVTAKKYTL